jgi:hypothetical protein
MTLARAWLIAFGLFIVPAMASQGFEPIGAIEATMDGRKLTWHVPGSSGGADGSGAMWMSIEPGTATAIIGGFESRDVEFDRDPATGRPVVAGEGSQIVLTFEFPLEASSAELRLPSAGPSEASILFMPAVGNYAVMHGMDEGEVSVSLIEARKTGSSRFEGTFSGRLVDGAGKVLGEITGGRFSVDGASFFDPEQVGPTRK